MKITKADKADMLSFEDLDITDVFSANYETWIKIHPVVYQHCTVNSLNPRTGEYCYTADNTLVERFKAELIIVKGEKR